MFPSMKSRFATAARRSFDLALEFATLGEYGLPEDPAPRPRMSARRPSAELPARPRATRLRPATAAARRLRAVEPSRQPVSSHAAMRNMAFDANGVRPAARGRSRAGAAAPPPQPCLVAEAGGLGTKQD